MLSKTVILAKPSFVPYIDLLLVYQRHFLDFKKSLIHLNVIMR
jgi:hypothetical protein